MFLLGSWLLWPTSEPDPATIDGPAISSGILNLEISPATEVRIFLDGNLIGNEPIMHYGDVTPGMGIPLRIEADGYETYEIAIDIESEERLRLPITLQAAPTANARSKTKPIQSVPKTPNFGTVYFSTRPSGAEIIMNGSLVGHTPMTWTDGIAGQVYRIEYKLSNYKSDSFSLTFPQNGKSSRFARSLSASALKPGKVSVNVRSGWAEVYIDGTKIDVTPLYNHTLTAGKHTIRVKNEQSGLDSEKVITIGSDKLTRVNF